ncbi:MAG: glycerol-3-phosphate 1-O-acyltransferase PlsY [Ilumatobacter sp.]|uniref:glycerol-3-phosphate 1-O-acyltransferase PlsY n=1 Tax=Ilumatobacter sp. TaxID=1967498 RepID=UPI0026072771|nr:glycerol-3-phosphate 1-O-acyltransferase PlsY [Ilumatobacter sp.]MDJ0771176.1 glycerol-3-phosphate 1-O-acyltransferase PlsY [Ilumatobacter sp.]
MWVLLLPIAYLIGTFPSAMLVARANGIDIRSVGSGNPGASNITRVLGWRRGVWVFVLDAAKGALAAGLGLLVDGRAAGYLLGAVAVIGHVFPAWQRFRGGKGVATGGGVFAVLSPFVFAGLVALWFVISRLTKKASVASIVIVAILPVGVGLVRQNAWEVLASAGICALVMARHLGNIKRLATRREHAISSSG